MTEGLLQQKKNTLQALLCRMGIRHIWVFLSLKMEAGREYGRCMPPKTEKLPDKSGSLDSGRRNVPSNYAAEDGSFTQRQLSAVESDKKINSQNTRVNGAVLLAGAEAALAYPWPADSPGCVNREPGPGSPLADMAAAPGEPHK